MVAKKVAPVGEGREVVYAPSRWEILKRLRGRAMIYLKGLEDGGYEAIVHGSVARGDVTEKSDVDIFIPEVCPSYAIEEAVGKLDRVSKRELTQATPTHTLKAILHVAEAVKVTFPLLPLRGRERDFYRFGGELGLEGLKAERRVPGVDKRLMVIVPTAYGHYEFSALVSTAEASKTLGIRLETMQERVRVLTRRDRIGRTGIFYKEELRDDETFEGKLRERASADPSLRRLLQQRGMEFKY
jgi:predicted nucleotidyltransferase